MFNKSFITLMMNEDYDDIVDDVHAPQKYHDDRIYVCELLFIFINF